MRPQHVTAFLSSLLDRERPKALKLKLIALTVGLFAAFLWVMATVSVTVLETQFEKVLSDQQFAATRQIAAQIETKLEERVESLAKVAAGAPADLSTASLDAFLERFPALHLMFSGGIAIIGMDGRAIADFPETPGRRGTYFGDRAYFSKVVETGKPYIDKPIIGRVLKRPVLTISVPIVDGSGKLRAVMTGITDLTAPNFLGIVSRPEMAGKGEIFVLSPHDRLLIAATDSARAMSPMPERGRNPMLDRFNDGFEGSGISVSAAGLPHLYSAKRVALSNWIVMLALPTHVAFGPLETMRNSLYVAAALMTLVAIFAMQWLARRMLSPLDKAGTAMRAMVGGQAALAPIPVERNDEVGHLISSFNLLVEDRHRYEQALKDSEYRLRKLVESAPDAIIVQMDGRFSYLNGAARRLFGAQSRRQLLGMPVLERIHEDFRESVGKHIRDIRSDKVSVSPEYLQFLRMDGRPVDVEVSAVPFRYQDEDGALVFARDVTERKRAEQNQKKLNRALRMLSDCNMTLVHAEREQNLLDEICRLVVFRGGYRMAWVGYAENDEAKTVKPVSQSGFNEGYLESVRLSWSGDTEYGRGPTGTAIRESRVQIVQDFMNHPSTGPWREAAKVRGYLSCIALPLISTGRTFGALSIYSPDPDSFGQDEVRLLYELATDLAFGIETLRSRTQRVVAEEKLAFLAHHDPLTHLPNRVLLRDRFDRAIAASGREQPGVAMMVLDLDNFKQVNDGLGHETGDKLLLAIVERLQRCIGDSDTICRQGGDEFVILLNGVHDSSVASRTAQSILDAVAEPFEAGAHTVNTSFSIGIGLYPDDGRDFDTLLKNANTALYHAKDNGRDTYHFFAASMNVNALARMELHGNLRKAVKNSEFVLHYQPQIDIASGAIVGVEALVRWQRGDEGLIPPGRFIALAEESGLIVPIGEWVLNEACRQVVAWQKAGMPALPVAVNLSAQQFKRGDILDTVQAALTQSGLRPELLELELTESLLLHDTATVMETLHQLKKIGVQLSIDDFGTGYSSLAYLKRLAVDKLKIDQSFVRDVPGAAEGAAIVKAIIQLGHALQLTVIAEGVETRGQLDFLQAHGCDQAQGYLVSRPVPADDLAAFVADDFNVIR
ncbi:EAL domain-containing protein [Noviherbaspirillum sp. ST9]|uniref:EAL domain-containing protein n=1 Tax=Noviherbaspirillum sp. ST9 TaxID=3401606 RepID=UPI003B58A4C7